MCVLRVKGHSNVAVIILTHVQTYSNSHPAMIAVTLHYTSTCMTSSLESGEETGILMQIPN